MSHQRKLTTYFGKRKRVIEDESNIKCKKTLLDYDFTCSGLIPDGSIKAKPENDDTNEENNKPETEIDTCSLKIEKKDDDLEGPTENTESELTNIGNVGDHLCKTSDSNESDEKNTSLVIFKYKGRLSPMKKRNTFSKTVIQVPSKQHIDLLPTTPEKQVRNVNKIDKNETNSFTIENPTDEVIKTAKKFVNKFKIINLKQQITKELSLKEIKDKLKQSEKLNELRKSINKINEQAAVLLDLENKKKENSVPKLSKFKAIEVDVPLGSQKNALYSPSKVNKSPAKPAYESFNFLAEASTALPLPFSFQKLFELFRAVDTISSMMISRGEDITFNNLKPSVQEMTRKTFTLRHLAQMAAVLPDAFTFHQEKVINFGSTSKTDAYELVITPTFPDDRQGQEEEGIEKEYAFQNSVKMSMTPKVLKARREAFYNALLDKTKDCHEEFLKSLDPPMQINRNDLKRWHPNFLVDHVPDIIPKELPELPDSKRPATAKEVLERAKDFLSNNPRLQKALESTAQSSDDPTDITSRISPDIKEKVDSRLCNPLKGISKSLLERVRARQAAKALDSMRMTREQEKESIMYTRLPAIARIVRTFFVNEKRNVLSWETVLEKVQFSYNQNLYKGEVESHMRLLVELLPEWLSIVHIRNSEYLKINPATELASVMSKLDKIVSEKAKNT